MKRVKKNAIYKDGYLFDSVPEVDRYYDLKCKELRGEVSQIHVHPVWLNLMILSSTEWYSIQHLKTKDKRRVHKIDAIHYAPDFIYREGDKIILDEIKSDYTEKFADYRLKRKLIVKYMQHHMAYRGNQHIVFRQTIVTRYGFSEKDFLLQ